MAFTLLNRTVSIIISLTSDIQSITETYDHFITGTLFLSVLGVGDRNTGGMKNADCLLRIRSNPEQTEPNGSYGVIKLSIKNIYLFLVIH